MPIYFQQNSATLPSSNPRRVVNHTVQKMVPEIREELAPLLRPAGLTVWLKGLRPSCLPPTSWSASSRPRSCPQPKPDVPADILRRRPEHQVCGIGDSAIKTARIVLATCTFEGPALPATRNKLTFTMRHATPLARLPAAVPELGDLARNHH